MKRTILLSGIIFVLLVFLAYNMYTLQALKKETRKEILNLSERVDNLQGRIAFQEKVGKGFLQKTIPTFRKDKDEEELFEKYKREVFKNLEADIASIVPGPTAVGGRWYTTKVKFITPDVILVHYEDGHILGQMIVRATKTEKGYSWEVLADE